MTDDLHHHGSCLCGGVRYEVRGPLRDVWACHCSQCRRQSGHVWAATSAPLSHLCITRDETLAWFEATPEARRGFCHVCGATLFWKPEGEARMAIAPGSLDGATGLRLTRHIFTEDAGDYYHPVGAPPALSSEVQGPLDCACLCGQVAFSLPAPAGAITACHCHQCRKLSGHYAASFDTQEEAVIWMARATLEEFETPAGGRRGFCSACGSSLYFRAVDGAFSVEAGAVTGPTGGFLSSHIFVADKGDYYELDDGLPQYPAG